MLRTCELYIARRGVPRYYAYINSFGAYEINFYGITEISYIPDDLKYRTNDIEDEYFRRAMKYFDTNCVFSAKYEDVFFDFVQIQVDPTSEPLLGDISSILKLFNEAKLDDYRNEKLRNMAKAMEILNTFCKSI